MAEESPEIQAALRDLDRELEVCTSRALVVCFFLCMIHDRRAISLKKGKLSLATTSITSQLCLVIDLVLATEISGPADA